MGDLLHWCVKRRLKGEESFLDSLYEEYRLYQDDPQNVGDKLRAKINDWLVEDNHFGGPSDFVKPLDIAATIMYRICEIAGHVWIEFVEDAGDDSIRGAAESRRESINAYVAEFNPEPDFDLDLMVEVFESAEGGEVPWNQITNEHLLKLFAPLLGDPNIPPPPPPERAPAGSVTGHPNLITPAKVREQSTAWFNDRREPYMTPAWEVEAARAAIASVIRESVGLRYSFTPEHEAEWANCVTWACGVLDTLVPGDWLEIIQTQCFKPSGLAPKGCEAYDVRAYGRMRCAEGYASLADAQRKEGLKRFL